MGNTQSDGNQSNNVNMSMDQAMNQTDHIIQDTSNQSIHNIVESTTVHDESQSTIPLTSQPTTNQHSIQQFPDGISNHDQGEPDSPTNSSITQSIHQSDQSSPLIYHLSTNIQNSSSETPNSQTASHSTDVSITSTHPSTSEISTSEPGSEPSFLDSKHLADNTITSATAEHHNILNGEHLTIISSVHAYDPTFLPASKWTEEQKAASLAKAKATRARRKLAAEKKAVKAAEEAKRKRAEREAQRKIEREEKEREDERTKRRNERRMKQEAAFLSTAPLRTTRSQTAVAVAAASKKTKSARHSTKAEAPEVHRNVDPTNDVEVEQALRDRLDTSKPPQFDRHGEEWDKHKCQLMLQFWFMLVVRFNQTQEGAFVALERTGTNRRKLESVVNHWLTTGKKEQLDEYRNSCLARLNR